MDKGTLLLEFVRVLLSWQVIFGSLGVYFLRKHHQVIGAILQRLSSVSFPGGLKVDVSPYPTTSDTTNRQASLPPVSGGTKGQESLPRQGDVPSNFEKDFRIFLWDGLTLYRNFIAIDVAMMWNYLLTKGGAFALTKEADTTKTVGERLQVLKRMYKMDDQAIRDHSEVATVSLSSSISELMTAYNKALTVHEYLFRHHSAHHEPA